MKIAFLLDCFPSLSETFILNQITGLIDRGHQVDIYPNELGNFEQSDPEVATYQLKSRTYCVEMPGLKRRLLESFGYFWSYRQSDDIQILKNALRWKYNNGQSGDRTTFLTIFYAALPLLKKQTNYDLIHCHFGRNGVRGVILREMGAISGKILTTFHGYDINNYPQSYPGKNVYEILFKQGDFYTSNSNFTANKAINLGCPPDKIVKLPVGVNLQKYTFRSRSLQVGEKIKIITVARLVEKKGLEYSIQAIGKIIPKYPHLIYEIIGAGERKQILQNLIDSLQLNNYVKLLGGMNQAELLQIYSEAHLFILPSVTATNGDMEGQGLVLQEAQARGIPVLTTKHNGIPEGVLEGRSGFLVPEKDVDALAERLEYLITHPEVWPEMGKIGREYVENNFDIEKLNDKLVSIYEDLINK